LQLLDIPRLLAIHGQTSPAKVIIDPVSTLSAQDHRADPCNPDSSCLLRFNGRADSQDRMDQKTDHRHAWLRKDERRPAEAASGDMPASPAALGTDPARYPDRLTKTPARPS
jgi:hypothetical protein